MPMAAAMHVPGDAVQFELYSHMCSNSAAPRVRPNEKWRLTTRKFPQDSRHFRRTVENEFELFSDI
jgi:hypothetical protein